MVFDAGTSSFLGDPRKIVSGIPAGGLPAPGGPLVFFLVMITLLCFVLMRQVWSREEKLRAREKSLEQKRHFIQMGELTGRIAHGVNTRLASFRAIWNF